MDKKAAITADTLDNVIVALMTLDTNMEAISIGIKRLWD